MSKNMNISIIGCGWLGLPLAKKLLEHGYSVKGSTTSREKMTKLAAKGITPYRIKILEEGVQGDLSSFLNDTDVLIINIPPGLRSNPDENFIGKMGRLKSYIEKSHLDRVIFISSTSVFEEREDFPDYTDEAGPNAGGKNKQLIAAEELFKSNDSFTTTIVRFGGLIGAGRHPVKFLAGKKNIPNPEAPVNLIHQDDCIGMIMAIIDKKAWGETFNGVSPTHPTKENYYTKLAAHKNLPLPQFDMNTASKGKTITALKVEEELGYKYQQTIWR